jgi:hypothetical protein
VRLLLVNQTIKASAQNSFPLASIAQIRTEKNVLVSRRIKMRKKKHSVLFDFIMTILTGGFWLIWVLVRYLRTH